MQTTIANRKQELGTTLPGPFGEEFKGAVAPGSTSIKVESDGTKLTTTLAPLNGGGTLSTREITEKLQSLCQEAGA